MRIKVLDEYTIGHSCLTRDDIIIGDGCGRWLPIDRAGLPEVIEALLLFTEDDDSTVSPDEFKQRGKELDGDETLEALYEATDNEHGDLYWKGTRILLDEPFPEGIYCEVVRLHEERG